jgi:hypothetical protein
MINITDKLKNQLNSQFIIQSDIQLNNQLYVGLWSQLDNQLWRQLRNLMI